MRDLVAGFDMRGIRRRQPVPHQVDHGVGGLRILLELAADFGGAAGNAEEVAEQQTAPFASLRATGSASNPETSRNISI